MNRDPSETKLENLLRSLVPEAPSAGLMERIDEELKLDMSWLNATARPRRKVNWLGAVGWSSVGAAAAVMVMSFVQGPQVNTGLSSANFASTQVPETSAMPVSTAVSRQWDVLKEEPVPTAGANKSRLEREKAFLALVREGHSWGTARDQARIAVTPPDEEKLVLPVNFLSEVPFPLPDLQPYRP